MARSAHDFDGVALDPEVEALIRAGKAQSEAKKAANRTLAAAPGRPLIVMGPHIYCYFAAFLVWAIGCAWLIYGQTGAGLVPLILAQLPVAGLIAGAQVVKKKRPVR